MAMVTVEIDLLAMIEKQIEYKISDLIRSEPQTYGYWARDIEKVIHEKLAEKFVEKYADEIFAGIARDETLTILIREKVIANMARDLKR